MSSPGAADPRESQTQHAYPEHFDNPVPRGGTQADWRRWADRLTAFSHFGVRCVSFEPGAVSFEMVEHVAPPNPNGSVHGGVIAAIMDDAVGAAFVSAASDDVLPATVSLTVDYLRPAFVPLRIDAQVMSMGRSLAHCEVVAYGPDGRLASRARAIMAVKRIVAVATP